MSKNSNNYRRCKTIWKVCRPVLGIPFKKVMNFHSKAYYPGKEPFLLVSNHTDAIDPGFLYATVHSYFRFVSSDHVVENPVVRSVVKFFADPIINHHGNSPDVVYNEMVDTLKSGINVSLMAEARVTDTGETGYISRRNATLVKEAGAGLVTFRIKGGYFCTPRWAESRRKGPVYGEVVHHYSADEVARMTEDEVFEAICHDLYVNAYEENRKAQNKYKSENPAEHVEYILYGCPKCGSIGHMHSKGDTLRCDSCGFTTVVDDCGFWHADNADKNDVTDWKAGRDFDNIPEWNAYQKELIYDLLDGATDIDTPLISCDGQLVYTMDEHNNVSLQDSDGVLTVYKDSIEVKWNGKTERVKGTDVRNVGYASKGTVLLVTDNHHFRIKTKTPRAANMFVVSVRYMQGKKTI